MKNPMIYLVVIAVCLSSHHIKADDLPSEENLRQEAINIVNLFSGTLKPKLKEGIKTGGLSHAINVCSVEAPKIAHRLSTETGWRIKRVSLKPRNRKNATPDAFEQDVLESFNERQIRGESPSLLEYSAVTDNEYRFMKAQAVEGICLNCHGSSIPPEVEKMIHQLYPEDVAAGYSLGQIRGAFSLIKAL